MYTLQTCLTSMMGRPITMDQLRQDVGLMVEKITYVTLMFRRVRLRMEEYVCLKVITMLSQGRYFHRARLAASIIIGRRLFIYLLPHYTACARERERRSTYNNINISFSLPDAIIGDAKCKLKEYFLNNLLSFIPSSWTIQRVVYKKNSFKFASFSSWSLNVSFIKKKKKKNN